MNVFRPTLEQLQHVMAENDRMQIEVAPDMADLPSVSEALGIMRSAWAVGITAMQRAYTNHQPDVLEREERTRTQLDGRYFAVTHTLSAGSQDIFHESEYFPAKEYVTDDIDRGHGTAFVPIDVDTYVRPTTPPGEYVRVNGYRIGHETVVDADTGVRYPSVHTVDYGDTVSRCTNEIRPDDQEWRTVADTVAFVARRRIHPF